MASELGLTLARRYKRWRARQAAARVDRLMPLIRERLSAEQLWMRNSYAMSPDIVQLPADAPFMVSSTCMAQDFYHPEFRRLCDLVGTPIMMHRKLWEWIFIVHHAFRTGAVADGHRGIVFGVGHEKLPATFAAAGMRITATDAPPEVATSSGWIDSRQHALGLDALPTGSLDPALFRERVEWRTCDMTAIDPALTGYDLCWSSCSLEHLGGIEPGLAFVEETVERVLAPGGVAIHTTELNLTSNEKTLDSGGTVLYRKRDLERLIDRLRARGHMVDALTVAPDSFVMDSYVDTAPYAQAHLRVRYHGFVTTSVGLVIRRRLD